MSSKSIYPIDLIAEALNMRPLGYELDYSIPEDAENVPLTGEELFYGGFKGHTHSKEHKQKLSILMKEKRANNLSMGNHKPHTQETKNKLSEAMMGKQNKLGKTGAKLSDEFKENQRQRMLTDCNPMSNPESIEKVRQKALKKFPCKHCGWEMNKGGLSRHEIKCK